MTGIFLLVISLFAIYYEYPNSIHPIFKAMGFMGTYSIIMGYNVRKKNLFPDKLPKKEENYFQIFRFSDL